MGPTEVRDQFRSSVYRIPILVFLFILIHGSLIGLTDDEAYYWVLAQKPALGYAYHPPAVAWFIAFFQKLFGWCFGSAQPGLVRLPAALSIAGILSLALNWLKEIGMNPKMTTRAALALLSFFGFFALSWMMVPDIPLFLGWTLLFVTTWKVCFTESKAIHFGLLCLSAALTLISKYSGVLALFSSFVGIGIWAPRSQKLKGWGMLVLGGLLAAIPILIWNSQHEWASILYQIRERHGGASISWIRYLRFWVVELVLAGPILIGFGFQVFWTAVQSKEIRERQVAQWIGIWVLPAVVIFCIQPLFSDFKPHWAFVVWWPMAIAMAWQVSGSKWKWIRRQIIYGFTLGIFIILCCHFPMGTWMGSRFSKGTFDPRLDVTNDLYGWSDLKNFIKTNLPIEVTGLKMVGTRYQTASQAAFSLSGFMPVTLLPRDIKERDEWPSLDVSESEGPGWSKLKQSVLFVRDNRYTELPEFPGAKCKSIGKLEKSRFGLPAKWIEIWKCDP